MNIIKRNGEQVDFDVRKIATAIEKAFVSVGQPVDTAKIREMALGVENKVRTQFPKEHVVTVEEVQDLVEIALIENQYYSVVKSYILYRASHHTMRKTLQDFSAYFQSAELFDEMRRIQNEFPEDAYNLSFLFSKFSSFAKEGMPESECLTLLIKAASELTSKESPKWEYIAARFLSLQIDRRIRAEMVRHELFTYRDKVHFLVRHRLYGGYITESYTDEDLDELERCLDRTRDHLFNFSGLDLVAKRYLTRDTDGRILESPQEMFLGIAMHLAIPEGEKRVHWAKRFYDILSTLKVTMATPTMSNARKPFHQLSSCFIDTVPDSLDGIYRSITNFSQVSKHGGGMGMYFGKVRAMGSDIRGFKGVAGGVIRWIKLANDTAVAVDQLGVRQGAGDGAGDPLHQPRRKHTSVV
ncbi:MAG: ATP cone domain-containing protein, partial [Bacillota bacterium]|nr:ATP cone domain-containing protein [Bacillota bacterium]